MRKLSNYLQVALFALIPTLTVEASEDLWSVTLFRSECFGACPNYQVTVFANGHVIFTGLNWVESKGKFEAQIDPANLRPLFEKIVGIDFWRYCDPKTQKVLENGNVSLKVYAPDVPTFWIRVVGARGSKKIEFDGYSGPIPEIGTLIDTVTGDGKWIGRPRHE